MMVKQQQIAILERIENLEQVGLEDCDINSLKPLYNSKTLERLEVGGTYVPSRRFSRSGGSVFWTI